MNHLYFKHFTVFCLLLHVLWRRGKSVGRSVSKQADYWRLSVPEPILPGENKRVAMSLIKLVFPNISGGSWKNQISTEVEQRLRCLAWRPQSLKELRGAGRRPILEQTMESWATREKWRGDCLPTTAGEEESSCQQTLKRAIQTRSHTKRNLNPVKLVPNVSYYSPVKGRLRQHFYCFVHNCTVLAVAQVQTAWFGKLHRASFLSPLPRCTELRSCYIHQRSCRIHWYLHWAGGVARQLYHESICTNRQWTESTVPKKHARKPGKREW